MKLTTLIYCLAFTLPCAYQQCTERPKVTDCQTTQLYDEGTLELGEYLESPNGRYRFIHGCDAQITFKDTINDLILYSAIPRPGGTLLVVQTDGNLVQYTASNLPTWASDTHWQCSPPSRTVLEVQDTPNVVVTCDGSPMTWAAVAANEKLNSYKTTSLCTTGGSAATTTSRSLEHPTTGTSHTAAKTSATTPTTTTSGSTSTLALLNGLGPAPIATVSVVIDGPLTEIPTTADGGVTTTIDTTPTAITTQQPQQKIYPHGPATMAALEAVHDIGCVWIITMLAAVIGVNMVFGARTYERLLHYCEEVTLLIAHILQLTLRNEVNNNLVCKVASIGMHYFFTAHFLFLLIDAVHGFALLVGIWSRPAGPFWAPLAIGFGVPACAVALGAAVYLNVYPSSFVCFVNLDEGVGRLIIVPTTIFMALGLVFVDSCGTLAIVKLPLLKQRTFESTICNQRMLWLLFPVGYLHWMFGAVALHYLTAVLFPAVFAITVALGLLYVKRAMATSPEFRRWFKSTVTKLRSRCCESEKNKKELRAQ